MGASAEKANDIQDQKLANGTKLNNHEEKPKGSVNEEVKESISSCCQGAKGFSCCRDGNSEEKPGEKEVGKCANWFGKWEQRDVLTTIGVVGVVATIAVAYGFYRRSK
jgi:hypothetical protein